MAESPQFKRKVWESLNDIGSNEMLNEGRVYGGGLHKLEPKELGRVPAIALADLLLVSRRQDQVMQPTLFGRSSDL